MKAIERFDKSIEFFLCALIFTLPISKAMVEVFIHVVIALWLVKKCIFASSRKSFKEFIKPYAIGIGVPFLVFLLFNFVSLIFSVSFPLSAEGFIGKWLPSVLLFIIVAETVNTKAKLQRLALVFISSMLLLSVDGIFQRIVGVDFLRMREIPGNLFVRASFGNPNNFAGWLTIMIPLVLSLCFFLDTKYVSLAFGRSWLRKAIKPIMYATCILLVINLLLTHSRGGLIAVISSLFFMGLLLRRKIVMGIMVFLLLLFMFAPPTFERGIVSSIAAKDQVSRGIISRTELWREAGAIIKDFPLFGAGINTYAKMGPLYKKKLGGLGFYPHNSYLHMGAELGLLGLGAFLWFLFMIFKISIRRLKGSNGMYHPLLLGLMSGLFAFLAHSFVDTNIYSLQLGVFMWFVMGFIVAVQNVLQKDPTPTHEIPIGVRTSLDETSQDVVDAKQA